MLGPSNTDWKNALFFFLAAFVWFHGTILIAALYDYFFDVLWQHLFKAALIINIVTIALVFLGILWTFAWLL